MGSKKNKMKFTHTLLLFPSIYVANLDSQCSCALQEIFDKISSVSKDFSSRGYNMKLFNSVMELIDENSPVLLEYFEENGMDLEENYDSEEFNENIDDTVDKFNSEFGDIDEVKD